ncbi:MAG TPA: TPM domain-containing protein [Chryseolinea sp.]|nr:TPM domain-containing protein [Chryseolinea sp.]
MKIREMFSAPDLQRIKDAVAKAEGNISGEIVPVMVERSGRYVSAHYMSAILGASFAFVAMIVFDRYVFSNASNALFYDPVFIFFVVTAAGFIGGVIPRFSDPLKRLLTGKTHLGVAAQQRAENAFLEEQVFNTRQRTGIMIFISFFEHKVIVMADKGISSVVDKSRWDEIVADLIGHIRQEKVVEGLEKAIARCGSILLEKGFKKSEDDTNELRDDLRLE